MADVQTDVTLLFGRGQGWGFLEGTRADASLDRTVSLGSSRVLVERAVR